MSLGQAVNLYKEVAKHLNVPCGGSVVELGCGPASVVPNLLQKIDNSSTIIGIDFSSQMIALANRKKEVNGWNNVQFECMDMYNFSPVEKVDSVVFVYSCDDPTHISTSIEEWKSALVAQKKFMGLGEIDHVSELFSNCSDL